MCQKWRQEETWHICWIFNSCDMWSKQAVMETRDESNAIAGNKDLSERMTPAIHQNQWTDDMKPVLPWGYFVNLGELRLWTEISGFAGQRACAEKAGFLASIWDGEKDRKLWKIENWVSKEDVLSFKHLHNSKTLQWRKWKSYAQNLWKDHSTHVILDCWEDKHQIQEKPQWI